MEERQEQIRSKGFDLTDSIRQYNSEGKDYTDYAKTKVGLRSIPDALIDVGTYNKVNSQFADKTYILNAVYRGDTEAMRKISNYYYQSSGIYKRLCEYLAFLYRYDWYANTLIINEDLNKNKLLKDFAKVLEYMDNSNVKIMCGNIALEIMKNGCYYGCVIELEDSFMIQQLPADYCRCRYYSANMPVVELNMRFFDACFPNVQYRMKVLAMFPKDIQRGYVLYKQGKLIGDYPGDTNGWFALDPQASIKFNLNRSDTPPFIATIPSIIDLDQAQDMDRKRTMQQLLKIIVQKLPLDKNGDLIFDVDEAKQIHNNAVAMLKRAVGIDVLTTFTDVVKIDTRDSNSITSTDDLERAERTVFNSAGVTKNVFNADGNLAVTNSILADESSIRDLILQFQSFLSRVVKKFSRKNQYRFGISMLETTQYNYRELSKMYESHTKIGFSKILPQIALGHSQSSILSAAYFENEILNLSQVMLPPMSSNTMSSSVLLGKSSQTSNSNSQSKQESDGQVGRPEKEDNQKSDKTIQNRESMS